MSRPRAKNKKNNGFRNLLFFLLLYIFGSPFLLEYQPLVVIAHLSLSVTLFFSVYAVQKQQNHRSFAVLMLLPLLTLYWLGIYDVITFSRLGSYIFSAIYFGLLVFSFATQILRTPKITLAVLYATLCLYLIIGLFWGTLYALLYELSPGSYSGALLEKSVTAATHLITFNYFSLITLTTLGYGDITPQTPGAGALCQLEAVVGQFFTAVVIAWLVGNFIRGRQDDSRH